MNEYNQQYVPGPRREFAFVCPQCGRVHHFRANNPFHAKCATCGCYLTGKKEMPPAATERQEENNQSNYNTNGGNAQ